MQSLLGIPSILQAASPRVSRVAEPSPRALVHDCLQRVDAATAVVSGRDERKRFQAATTSRSEYNECSIISHC